jgi:hypothetical protein
MFWRIYMVQCQFPERLFPKMALMIFPQTTFPRMTLRLGIKCRSGKSYLGKCH